MKPCQDLSVAGKRGGIGGARSGLFFEFARIADELAVPWLVIENVPGLMSGADDVETEDVRCECGWEGERAAAACPACGRDVGDAAARLVRAPWMGAVLGELADSGFVGSWTVLDSRWFGVPQRRRRLFIVGHRGGLGDRAGEILFESPRCRRNFEEGLASGPRVAACLRGRSAGPGVNEPGRGGEDDANLIAFNPTGGTRDVQASEDAAPTVRVGSGLDIASPPVIAFNWMEDRTFKASAEHTNPRRASQTEAVAFTIPSAHRGVGNGHNTTYLAVRGELIHTLTTQHGVTEDGTGRGVPVMAYTLRDNQRNTSQRPANYIPILEVGARTNGDGDRDGDGIGQPGDPMFTLQAGTQHGIAEVASPLMARDANGLRNDGMDNLVAATLNSGGNAGGFRTEPGEHIMVVRTRNLGQEKGDVWTKDDEVGALQAISDTPNQMQAIMVPLAVTDEPMAAYVTDVVSAQSPITEPLLIGFDVPDIAVARPARSVPPDSEVAHALTQSMHKRHDEDTDTLITSLTAHSGGNTSLDPTNLVSGTLAATGMERRDHDDLGMMIAAPVTASAGHHGHSSARGDGQDNLVASWDPRNVTSSANRSTVEYGRESNTLHAAGLSIVEKQQARHGVRRLTPLECARLQNFPDGWCCTCGGQVKGSQYCTCSDTAQYRAYGNAVTVSVVTWIAKRLMALGFDR